MNWVALVFLAFLSGSLPFSVWLGKLFLHKDVRAFGDGNPGATNAFRAGSRLIGLLVLLLDVTKAALPVGLAYFNLEMRGIPIYLIAIAPLIGHICSPFLGFRGGKGLATALGVWIGLTIWKASLAGVVGALIGLALLTSSAWAVMFALALILSVLLLWMPETLLLQVWASQTLILAWTHRAELKQIPHLRAWLAGHDFRGRA